jgi:rhamnogalacturonyl hydrolase YesR
MKWTLDKGWISIVSGQGHEVAGTDSALEMEVAGKAYRGSWQTRKGSRCYGTLGDKKGAFLRAEASFKERFFHGVRVLEEKRTYQALRPLPKALLTIRYNLQKAPKPKDGFLVIPTLWYGDNEAWNHKITYPKGLDKDWSFKADGSSCPAVVWTTSSSSYALAVDPSVNFSVKRPGLEDVPGIGFAQMKSLPQAVFTFPAQEIPQSYPRARNLKNPLKPRMDWKKGQSLTITLYHSADKSDRAYHTRIWRAHMERVSKPFRYRVDLKRLEKTAGLFTHCLKESHYREGQGFSHRHDITEIFTGWCGGFAAAYAAIRWGDLSGDPAFRRMGDAMCDFISREGLSLSGIFYSEYTKGLWLQKVFWGTAQGIHMRNPSEGACYLALILQYERAKGNYRALWDQALRSNLDAVVRMQRADGAIPHEINGKTGKALSWVGATSGAWAGALAVYSRFDENPARARRYLTAAKKAAAYYLKNYVMKERYIGGPYDTYMAPNMEDPYNLLLAYSELYETTREKKWLAASKTIADHLLSWRYLYDVRFPDGTICRKNKVKTYHMSPASVSNKHIQNWDTLANPYLFRLSKWLKDPFYADCANQHLMASTQLVQEGQLPKGIPFGGQSEQWYATDFNWFGDCGNYSKGNLWQITVALPKAGFLISMAELKTLKLKKV